MYTTALRRRIYTLNVGLNKHILRSLGRSNTELQNKLAFKNGLHTLVMAAGALVVMLNPHKNMVLCQKQIRQ